MTRFVALLCIGFLFCVAPVTEARGEMQSKLRWRLDVGGFGPQEGYIGRLMIFLGPIGVGTAYDYEAYDISKGSGGIIVDNTYYLWTINKGGIICYFPVIIHYTPYSGPLWYGNIGVYGYLKGSSWSKHELRGFNSIFYEHSSRRSALIIFGPSSWFDLGLGISFNPFRVIPLDLRIGYVRMYYPYYRIPDPYKGQIPHTPRSNFYISLLLSLGYQSAR